MWSLRQKPDGEIYLTFDRSRRSPSPIRGIWQYVGAQDIDYTYRAVQANQEAGLLCCRDDEGGVRVLVLTE